MHKKIHIKKGSISCFHVLSPTIKEKKKQGDHKLCLLITNQLCLNLLWSKGEKSFSLLLGNLPFGNAVIRK